VHVPPLLALGFPPSHLQLVVCGNILQKAAIVLL